jgi:hypothetical protein
MISALTTQGCNSTEFVVYPQSWPARNLASSCADISGVYANEAVDASRASDPSTQVPSNGFLASVLQEGTLSYFDENQRRIYAVKLDVDQSHFELFATNNSVGSSHSLRPEWKCNATGALDAMFVKQVDSEGSVNSEATTNVELFAAADGSLIVHYVVHIQASFPPGVDRRESWAKFARQGKLP